ncbi:hypothetical protein POJ06DRAFT_197374 [Lipomyces tetrasporus]|uniref:Uncharacterized protein n=1 Tax=Lipomyces tetrasporus TaxID=54092 RepID=A0AAD7VU01_9ASCO|nr:uncharacterized protein POJ06DRAFT_197374 [Lipomyces tetrasporus]KAJ8100690.1 hypothetical protein POJ06DRAFT_197374 [Lipomyces tetrasporus]
MSATESEGIKLIPVSLKEAALDSPSFRTAALHVHDQVDAVERWIDLYVKAGHRLSNDADSMQETVNMLLGRSFPTFITENIIDHDYTLTAMKSYSEGLRIFWSNFIKCVKGMEKNVIEQLENLHRKEIRQYKDIKRNFDSAQSRYDTLVARYASQSKTKEPSALREDAFQLYEARRQYVKTSFDLCLTTVSLRHALDRTIIQAFSDQWLMFGHDINETSNSPYSNVAANLRRIRKWSDQMKSSLKVLFKELSITRRDLEGLVLSEISPPRELSEYSTWTVSNPIVVIDKNSSPSTYPASRERASVIDPQTADCEKHGWLFLRTYVGKPARQVWVRRWVFVKDGIFGMLVQSPNRTYVEESDKIGVLLCNVKPSTAEDRRYCFEVTTKDTTLMFQAESQKDLASWLGIFEIAKRKALESSNVADTDKAFAIIPPLPEFASTAQTSADTELSHERHESLPVHARTSLDLSRAAAKRVNAPAPTLQALISAGQTFAGQHASQNFISGADRLFDEIVPPSTSLAPTTLANNPLATSMTKTAIVAHATVPPVHFPNGLTANVWGSVNWAARQDLDDVSDSLKKSDKNVESETAVPPIVIVEPPQEEGSMSPVVLQQLYDNRTYPSFYPYELKVQDAQLRSLLPDISLEENVVMVFRAVWNGTTSQEFSGRVYLTQYRAYFYANNGDMIFIRRRSIGDFISVRGESNENFDSVYADFKDGEMSAKTYLDSGQLIQYRLQLLIDNFKSPTPLELEALVQKLKEAKVNTIGSQSEGWDDMPTTLAEDENADSFVVTTNHRPIALDRGLLSPTKQLPERKVRSKIKLPERPVEYDLSKTMDRRVYSEEFDISAKALFHLLFGDKSVIFQSLYYGSGAINVHQSPWIHLSGRYMEREFSFKATSTLVRGWPRTQGIRGFQKIERMEEYLLYVVADSHTPWNLPSPDVYSQINRYVVSYVSKSSCRLTIWSSTEWTISSPFVQAFVQGPALEDLAGDAKTLSMLIKSNVRKLGAHGSTSKSIQLYGQVGKSTVPVEISDKGLDIMALQDKGRRMILLSRRSFIYLMFMSAYRLLESGISSILVILFGVIKRVLSFADGHSLLLAFAIGTLVLNIFLGTRSTVAFWTERRAYNTLNQLGVRPNGILAKAVYLNDLNDYINDGKELAVNPAGSCYSKFRSLSEFLTPDSPIEFVDSSYTNDITQEAARRVWMARQRAGIERHQHIVALRVISKMEEELVAAEWSNWLQSEHMRCVELLSRETLLNKDAGLNAIVPDTSDDGTIDSNATDWEAVIREYCQSCNNEFSNGRQGLI